MRLAILGGGGFRVPQVVGALRKRPGLGVDEVVLHDIDAHRLAVIMSVLGDAPPTIRATISLADAVLGADVIFSAIRVGGADARVRDERRALSLGVLGQETVGAGGIAYGLRTLPVVLAASKTIADLAPDAWTINFTNPAGMITEAMRTVLGERVIGICDSPVGLIRRTCTALGVRPSDAVIDYAGLNHLGWLRSLRVDGRDLLPGLLSSASVLGSFEEGRLFGGTLLRALGALPIEYLYFYYRPDDVLRSLRDAPTRGEVVREAQAAFYQAADGQNAAELWEATRRAREQSYLAEARSSGDERDEQDLSGGGYEQVALDLIAALTGGPPAELIVNVANGTTLPQLPADAVVEVPCIVDANGAIPRAVDRLTLHQLGLVASVRAAERAAIDAVLHRSREHAVHAFAVHPLVCSQTLAEALLEGLLGDDPGLARLLHTS
ncbi:MAG: 6-phospho-beta-glucosidase [Actinomycetota bacterium]